LTSHDQLAKNLLETFFDDFMRLAAPEAAARLRLSEAVFLDKQAFTDWPEGNRREMDLLAEVPVAEEGGGTVLVHIEIESSARAGISTRLWRYYMQIRLRHGLQVISLLVNLKGGRPGVHREQLKEGFEEWEAASFRFRVFSLSGCLAEDYLARPEPLAWALAALMRPGRWSRAEHKLECLRRIAAAELPGGHRWLLGNWVETYLQLRGREATEYARLCDLAVNREVRAMEMTWEERMEKKYTQKGLEKGMEKGLAQGRLDALRSVVLRLLRHRFGAVPESVQSRVEAMDEIAPLSDLAERVLEIDSIEEMGLG
jgi:hypothetical protein